MADITRSLARQNVLSDWQGASSGFLVVSPRPGGSFRKGLGGENGSCTLEENSVILFIVCSDREDIVCSL